MFAYAAIIGSFLLLMIVLGLYVSRRVDSADDWAVAGRSLGVVVSTGTYFATIVSSVSVIGYTGYYYELGWGGFFNWTGAVISSSLLALWFAGRIRRYGKVTLADYFEERFGRTNGLICAVIVMGSAFVLLCAQLVGMGAMLNTLFGFNPVISVLVLSVVFIIFTVVGGMIAVAYTDTLASFIIIIGLYIMMFIMLGKVGGFGALHATLAETNPKFLDPFSGGDMKWPLIISWGIVNGVGNIGAAQYVTRFYSSKDENTARTCQGITPVIMLLAFIPLMLIALSASILIPGIKSANVVMPTILLTQMPVFAGGVVASALLMASISTADSVLLLAGTTASRDIYQKYINKNAGSDELLKISRWATLGIGVAAMGASLFMSASVLWIQTNMQNVICSTLALPVIAGFVCKRVNSTGTLVGMIGGGLTAMVWFAIKQPFGVMPSVPGLAVCAVLMFAVSYATKAPSAETVETFFGEGQFDEEDEKEIKRILDCRSING
ncbi:sodium:solute symporter family protein [Cloacibacillus evryensis]|uniref:sodium:solute symporter family protein n=1 Tax=Cloacibacillus evryensis TaxID=508460 RepID=UPI00044EA044|nr:sodium:solute symporter family protein [Cloacibacillus evryensis]EXG78609.1 Na+/proline symporter [Cloacibacillus evryensis DSM 19522]MEA5035555.1 sodium:solute symporter family protein [Cloacibacillus evryensis]